MGGCRYDSARHDEKCGTDEASEDKVFMFGNKGLCSSASVRTCLHCEQKGSRRVVSGCRYDTAKEGERCETDEVSERKFFVFQQWKVVLRCKRTNLSEPTCSA